MDELPRTDNAWTEILDDGHCWELLRSRAVGRLGVLVDSAPEIYPVTFGVVAHTVVFRTDDGTKLRGIDRSPSVCFQADSISESDRRGWSVLVKGRARVIDGVDDVELPGIEPWTVGGNDHWVEITVDEISGRRIGRGGDLG